LPNPGTDMGWSATMGQDGREPAGHQVPLRLPRGAQRHPEHQRRERARLHAVRHPVSVQRVRQDDYSGTLGIGGQAASHRQLQRSGTRLHWALQAGIHEVVYLCDKSKHKPLVEASRRMFEMAGWSGARARDSGSFPVVCAHSAGRCRGDLPTVY
jgi:hypothetical protein